MDIYEYWRRNNYLHSTKASPWDDRRHNITPEKLEANHIQEMQLLFFDYMYNNKINPVVFGANPVSR